MIHKQIKNLCKYRWLIQQLVARDLKVKYKRSLLGYLWSLLNPLLMMLVISTVFSFIFRYNISNFPIYLLCGSILFNFYSESTSMAMSSIIQGAGLIKKVYIPKYILPLSKVISSLINLCFSLTAIAIMLVITRTKVYWTIILFPIPIIYLFFICLGAGLILCVLATYFRDMLHLYTIITQILMYLTPIFYPVDALPANIQFIIKFNPMYHIVTYFRDVVMYGTVPSLRDNIVCIGFAALAMVVGLAVFRKQQSKFMLHV